MKAARGRHERTLPGENPGTPRVIRVVLVDDHEDVRSGFGRFLASQPGLDVVATAGTVAAARNTLATLRPDVAVLDAHLPDGTGLELCREVRSAFPATACVILTAFDTLATRVGAVIAGAAAFVVKRPVPTELADAVRAVAGGARLYDEHLLRLARKVFSPTHPPVGQLTPRERQIADLMADGRTNREIAFASGLTEASVRAYTSTVAGKITAAPIPDESHWWRTLVRHRHRRPH